MIYSPFFFPSRYKTSFPDIKKLSVFGAVCKELYKKRKVYMRSRLGKDYREDKFR